MTKGKITSLGETDTCGPGHSMHGKAILFDPYVVALQIQPVFPPRYAKSLAELSRSVTELRERATGAIALHDVETLQGLEGTEKNGASNSRFVGDDIHAEVHAVADVDVEMARSPKHHCCAQRGPAIGMRPGIARSGIRLDLDNPAPQPNRANGAHQNLSEEIRSHLERRPGVKRRR